MVTGRGYRLLHRHELLRPALDHPAFARPIQLHVHPAARTKSVRQHNTAPPLLIGSRTTADHTASQ